MCIPALYVSYVLKRTLLFAPSDFGEDRLSQLFSAFGPIARLKFVPPEEKDAPGYGFVQFADSQSASKALDGAFCVFSHVLTPSKKKGTNSTQQHSTLPTLYSHAGLQNYRLDSGDKLYMSVALRRRSSLSDEPTNLYVRNLPKHFTNQDLIQLFRRFGKIQQSRVQQDGIAFVRFETHHQALAAIDHLNDRVLKEYPGQPRLEVRFATRKHAAILYRNQMYAGGPKQNLNNLYIRYLPHNMAQSDLESLFSKYGRISSAKLSHTGIAFVRYVEAEGAERAIKFLHGSRLPNSQEPLVVKLAF